MDYTQSIPEKKIVADVTTRIHDRFPEVEAPTVERAVLHKLDEYADSKVRDFLPILIEREVVDQFRR